MAINRWLAGVSGLGAVPWLAAWHLQSQVDLAINRGTGGWTEGQLRALLNPGIVFLLPLAWLFRRAQAGRDGRIGLAGAGLTSAGLFVQLIGNILEFGWWDNRISDWGWGVLLAGWLPLIAGWLLLSIGALRARALPMWVAIVTVLMAMLLPAALATGLASTDLEPRQSALDRLLIGTGIGWLVLAVGLLLRARTDSTAATR